MLNSWVRFFGCGNCDVNMHGDYIERDEFWYRIPTEPEILKKTGPLPCLGIGCVVWKTGDIAVGDDVFADVGPQPKMREN
ncbi:hypothetical protein AVEN_218357-1 [Araneus ventricosus]|uniref:Uncharacterized protein n=2 Tax=Araneus ventricosus TaxID=182803 RepID=A0A4Y2TE62_ARAVE|nr:hypothetical protein AVEN_218357-1 [Araneus ventricosus]